MDRFEALNYVWEKSRSIRNWYITDHDFDINSVTPYNVRTFGLGAPSYIVDMIIHDGVLDGIIVEDDDGVTYHAVN